MGRFLLNPLRETACLWYTDPNTGINDILSLDLHPLQSCVRPQMLLRALQSTLCRFVNERGVHLHEVCAHTFHWRILQFVCGLGPRTARALFDYVVAEVIISRANLLEKVDVIRHYHNEGDDEGPIVLREGVLTQKVYQNCAGFLIVKTDDDDDDDDDSCPFDATRIHPESYNLAIQVRLCCLDVNHTS